TSTSTKHGASSEGGGDVIDAWPRVLEAVKLRRPMVAAVLEHAAVTSDDKGNMVLMFEDNYTVGQAEKARADVEQAAAGTLGRAVGFVITAEKQRSAAAAPAAPVRRSEVEREASALAADRRHREEEARHHPMIRKAQELFGATPREIKTE